MSQTITGSKTACLSRRSPLAPNLTFGIVGATLLVMAVTLGKISGSHINPAVTVGLTVVRKSPVREGVAYIVAQLISVFLALGGFRPRLSKVLWD